MTKCKETFTTWSKSPLSADRNGAMQFLYLNRNRFFGLGGWMNADRYARNTVVDRIRFFGPRMKRTDVFTDAFDIPLSPTDFVFCDPPYPDTNNKSCYDIDNATVLDLNLRYLTVVANAKCPFLFITKNVPSVMDAVKLLGVYYEVKRWSFRKPGKDVQISEELWISKEEPKNPFEIS